jgi:hypothetical protein
VHPPKAKLPMVVMLFGISINFWESQSLQGMYIRKKALLPMVVTPSVGCMNPPSPANHTQRLRATLSSVARSIKLNFANTLARKSNKRASSPSPLSSPLLTPKRQCLMVTPPTTSNFLPLQSSTVSRLTQSS